MGYKGDAKMAHMMKFTRSSCGHMLAHFDRSANNISNENLDPSRTHLNYNLADQQNMKQMDFIRTRCSEVHCQNRKDVNVMVSWVVTVPKDLPQKEHDQFFKSSYDFLKTRYGWENVVSCYVHKDEVTPHMHFAFVPVKFGFKEKRNNPDISVEYHKVSAKEVVTRYDLKTFHEDLQKYLEKSLGHEVGILNEATKDGNRSIEELKRQSATERLQKVNEKASQIVSRAEFEANGIKGSIISVNAEYEAKKAYIKEMDKVSQVSMMYPSEVKVTEKGLINKQKFVTVPAEMWEARHISVNEKEYIHQANDVLDQSIEKFKKTTSSKNLGMMMKCIKDLKEENKELSDENLKLKSQVLNSEKKNDRIMEKINKVLDKLSDDHADRFISEWNKIDQNKTKTRYMDIDFER